MPKNYLEAVKIYQSLCHYKIALSLKNKLPQQNCHSLGQNHRASCRKQRFENQSFKGNTKNIKPYAQFALLKIKGTQGGTQQDH